MPDKVSVPDLRALLRSSEPPIVLDVRRERDFAESPQVIPGAVRRLPESVDAWADGLPASRKVVAYCVHGRQVSQGVAERLAQRGIEASFLEGGIEQWKADGARSSTPASDERRIDVSVERASLGHSGRGRAARRRSASQLNPRACPRVGDGLGCVLRESRCYTLVRCQS